MAIRQLRLFDDTELHRPCRKVPEVTDHIRDILADMTETLYSTKTGAGLAACQIGILKRLVVIDMGEGLLQLVNPKIVRSSGVQECMEACLSFPNLWGKVIRPRKVTVQAWNEWGEEILLTGERELAQCLCHEIDHLDGIVFLDRAVEIYREKGR